MFDLSKNNLSEIAELGYEFEVKMPDGSATGAFITVRGEQSKKAQAHVRKMFAEYQAKELAAQRRGKQLDPITLEEAEERNAETAAVRTISWRGFGEKGQEIPFTPENAKRIYLEHEWIRDQVMEESKQILNFRPK